MASRKWPRIRGEKDVDTDAKAKVDEVPYNLFVLIAEHLILPSSRGTNLQGDGGHQFAFLRILKTSNKVVN